MSKNGKAAGNEVAQQTAWLRALRQGPAAFMLGIQVRQLREYADAPRNEDGTYPAPELIEWWAKKSVKVVELPADDVERCYQALGRGMIDRPDDFFCALVQFFDRVERQHGVAGVLGIIGVWRKFWEERSLHFPGAAGDTLLDHLMQCTLCGSYSWAGKWAKDNPRPALEVWKEDVCPTCIAKGQR